MQMLGIGLPELFVILILSALVIGPDRIPQVAADLATWIRRMRAYAVHLQRDFNDVMGDLEYRTGWVATVIKCGPLLGLFGTVLGMMAAFGRIGSGEKVQPYQIADEISIALICTAMGLATAIPFNFMLASLTTRIRRFQDALGAGLMRILDFLKSAT